MQRFAAALREGLMEAGHEVRVLRPDAYLGRLWPSATGIGKWLGYVDRLAVFPVVLRRALRWPDVVHVCDHANAIYVKYLTGHPHIVTCHDMLAIRSARGEIPQNPTRWTGRQYQRMILDGLNNAQRVACVSRSTMEDLLRISKLPAQRVGVIPNGLNYPYRPMRSEEAKGRLAQLGPVGDQPFFLHVGGNLWYKNRPGVLEIFSHLVNYQPASSFKLIMVGPPLTAAMRRSISDHGISERVIELQNVDNEDLRALYSMAKALLFPSFYEGFGWPIVEAQACGCPVFTSNRPPMTDVAGSGACYVDPTHPQEAAQQISARLGTLCNLRERGLQNVGRFTLSRMIEGYVREYQSLVKSQ